MWAVFAWALRNPTKVLLGIAAVILVVLYVQTRLAERRAEEAESAAAEAQRQVRVKTEELRQRDIVQQAVERERIASEADRKQTQERLKEIYDAPTGGDALRIAVERVWGGTDRDGVPDPAASRERIPVR